MSKHGHPKCWPNGIYKVKDLTKTMYRWFRFRHSIMPKRIREMYLNTEAMEQRFSVYNGTVIWTHRMETFGYSENGKYDYRLTKVHYDPTYEWERIVD